MDQLQRQPRVGHVTLAFPGYYLGEEKAPAKHAEMLAYLQRLGLDVVPATDIVLDRASATRAGRELAAANVDCICANLATFVPDHYLVDLLAACDVPVFLWAIEREIDCLSLVGGMLINPTLYELGKRYQLYGADIGDTETGEKLMIFARACMARRSLAEMRVGYMGGNPDIMFSMAADEYGLKKTFGVSVIPLRDADYLARQAAVRQERAEADWAAIKVSVGKVQASDRDGIAASAGFIGVQSLARELGLDAISMNCWPHQKAKICLPIARLNDEGVGAGCEGDLHSTILMRLLYVMSGRAPINGDFLRMYLDANTIMFSHCGAGSFSMARNSSEIVLMESIETHDGLAVFFPADQPGTVTALNLMGSRAGYRLAAMVGEVAPTDMSYMGTPMRLRFSKPVKDILQGAVQCGAGHHWSLGYGDFSRELGLLCDWLGVQYRLLSSH
ncbi:MAG: hypothetical protein M1546_20795 [Chloroflexi bacterium]|nr:hypothetical protein [Chloroflexota bacterium]